MINQEYLRQRLQYLSDGTFVWLESPRAGWVGRRAGTLTGRYWRLLIDGKMYQLHRMVWMWHHGECVDEIDHINGNRNDNRIENLRQASRSQNNQNSAMRKDNSSGVRGVHWHKASGKWAVSIMANKRAINLGLHDDLEFAELVAQEARRKYHGPFARYTK